MIEIVSTSIPVLPPGLFKPAGRSTSKSSCSPAPPFPLASDCGLKMRAGKAGGCHAGTRFRRALSWGKSGRSTRSSTAETDLPVSTRTSTGLSELPELSDGDDECDRAASDSTGMPSQRGDGPLFSQRLREALAAHAESDADEGGGLEAVGSEKPPNDAEENQVDASPRGSSMRFDPAQMRMPRLVGDADWAPLLLKAFFRKPVAPEFEDEGLSVEDREGMQAQFRENVQATLKSLVPQGVAKPPSAPRSPQPSFVRRSQSNHQVFPAAKAAGGAGGSSAVQ
eukprot:TRINITY_DN8744_c0_g1_i1.p1 TRINITY_DN8744_c0_g1~~TRINITY_DN8744_c0_g1_i1.p1  ORF type:complete len:282 (+),score=65.35 TRINITY_DN8744_c0_g1_i1:204-1049(+)